MLDLVLALGERVRRGLERGGSRDDHDAGVRNVPDNPGKFRLFDGLRIRGDEHGSRGAREGGGETGTRGEGDDPRGKKGSRARRRNMAHDDLGGVGGLSDRDRRLRLIGMDVGLPYAVPAGHGHTLADLAKKCLEGRRPLCGLDDADDLLRPRDEHHLVRPRVGGRVLPMRAHGRFGGSTARRPRAHLPLDLVERRQRVRASDRLREHLELKNKTGRPCVDHASRARLGEHVGCSSELRARLDDGGDRHRRHVASHVEAPPRPPRAAARATERIVPSTGSPTAS